MCVRLCLKQIYTQSWNVKIKVFCGKIANNCANTQFFLLIFNNFKRIFLMSIIYHIFKHETSTSLTQYCSEVSQIIRINIIKNTQKMIKYNWHNLELDLHIFFHAGWCPIRSIQLLLLCSMILIRWPSGLKLVYAYVHTYLIHSGTYLMSSKEIFMDFHEAVRST